MNRQAWQAVVGDYRGEVQEAIDCSSYGEACELIGDIAQRKLLEYLIENRYSDISQHSTDERVYLKRLLKEPEASQ